MSSLERKLRLRTEFLQWLYDVSDGEADRMQDESDFLTQSDGTEAELDALIRHLEGERLVRTFLHLGGLLPAGVELTPMGVLEVEAPRRASLADVTTPNGTGPLDIHGNQPLVVAGARSDVGSMFGGGPREVSRTEGSSTDASSTDASSTDASSTDASSTDASSTDASSTDASSTDGSSTGTDDGTRNGGNGTSTVADERGNGNTAIGLEDELKVASYVTAFRANLDRLGLDDDAYAQAFADVNTLEAQLRAPHPHLSVVRYLSLALHATIREATDDEACRAIRDHPLPW